MWRHAASRPLFSTYLISIAVAGETGAWVSWSLGRTLGFSDYLLREMTLYIYCNGCRSPSPKIYIWLAALPPSWQRDVSKYLNSCFSSPFFSIADFFDFKYRLIFLAVSAVLPNFQYSA
ncbi:hypothetical protein F4820DRAFT_404326 [Hypoxylon rubiginosum]|uniref:Uncharacterized protein n=1 Tax=Hypoxylon rubiginosum TaxID=110542 RepID=A0ACB9ZFR0_9PEZI|nr:hypothetical protein F4820DRAFT_404326 [Hypoxylon rubiginosum]